MLDDYRHLDMLNVKFISFIQVDPLVSYTNHFFCSGKLLITVLYPFAVTIPAAI